MGNGALQDDKWRQEIAERVAVRRTKRLLKSNRSFNPEKYSTAKLSAQLAHVATILRNSDMEKCAKVCEAGARRLIGLDKALASSGKDADAEPSVGR